MEDLIVILVLIIFWAYVLIFYLSFINLATRKKKAIRFHNAVIFISKLKCTEDDAIDQLGLHFNKLNERFGKSREKTLLDMLETLFHYYDTYDDKRFESFFNVKKDTNIREYVYKLCKRIKEKDPFLTVSAKEANLLNNIKDALLRNNMDLGTTSLTQLSKELSNKEVELKKMERQNLIATIISVVGIIISVIFGILSLT